MSFFEWRSSSYRRPALPAILHLGVVDDQKRCWPCARRGASGAVATCGYPPLAPPGHARVGTSHSRHDPNRPPPTLAEGRPRPVPGRRRAPTSWPWPRPGAGKTTFALTAARHELAATPWRLVVVAPTAHLKTQWARAAAALSLHLDPSWSAADGALPADMHGIVTSYQQVACSADALARLAHGRVRRPRRDPPRRRRARVGRARSCTPSPAARRRLALSGTPFRSDTRAIPFVDLRGRRGRARLRVRLRRRARRRARRAAGVLPAHERRTWSGRRRTARCTRPRSTTRSTRPAPASGCARRCRSRASGCRPCCGPRTTGCRGSAASSPTPAAWSSRPTRSTPAASRRCCGRASARPPGRRPPTTRGASAGSSRLRPRRRAMARGRADGVRGRRHPAAARRRLRHDDHDRAVLPPGGRAASSAGRAGVTHQRACLFIPDDPRLRARPHDRRAAPPHAAPPGRRAVLEPRLGRRAAAQPDDEQLSLFAVDLGRGHGRRRAGGRRALATTLDAHDGRLEDEIESRSPRHRRCGRAATGTDGAGG